MNEPNYRIMSLQCPHCGSRNSSNAPTRTFFEYATRTFFEYVCKDCGVKFNIEELIEPRKNQEAGE